MDSYRLPEEDFADDQTDRMLPESKEEALALERPALLEKLDKELASLLSDCAAPEELDLYVSMDHEYTYFLYYQELANLSPKQMVSPEMAIQKLLNYFDFYVHENRLEEGSDVLINIKFCKLISLLVRDLAVPRDKTDSAIKQFIKALKAPEVRRSLPMKSPFIPFFCVFFQFFPTELSNLPPDLQKKFDPGLLPEIVQAEESEFKSLEKAPATATKELLKTLRDRGTERKEVIPYHSTLESASEDGVQLTEEDLRIFDSDAAVRQANLKMFGPRERKRETHGQVSLAESVSKLLGESQTTDDSLANQYKAILTIKDLKLVLENPLLQRAEAEQIADYLMKYINDIPGFKKAIKEVIEALINVAAFVSAEINVQISAHLNAYIDNIKDEGNQIEPRLQFEILQAIYLGLAKLACMNPPMVIDAERYALRRRDIINVLCSKIASPSEVKNEFNTHTTAQAIFFIIPRLTLVERSLFSEAIRGADTSILSAKSKEAFLKLIADVIRAEQEQMQQRSVVTLGLRATD